VGSVIREAVAVGTFADRVLVRVAGQINLFLAGKVPLAILPLLAGGRGGITLASMGNGEQEYKRLFAAPSIWYRMASMMVQRLVIAEAEEDGGDVSKLVGKEQMALGIPNAVETAKTRSDRFFRENLKTLNAAELHIDAVAMYNNMERGTVMEAVRQFSPRLGFFAAPMLEGPFLVAIFRHSRVFLLERGLVIGDPIAGLLAAMNARPLLESMAKEVKQVTAFADNFILGDTADVLKTAYPWLRERGKRFGAYFESRASDALYIGPGIKRVYTAEMIGRDFPGLTANVTEPWIRGYVLDIETDDALALPNVVVVGQGAAVGMRDLGIPKGSPAFQQLYVEFKMKRVGRDAAVMSSTVHPRVAYKILKRSLTQRLTFLARVVLMVGEEWSHLVKLYDAQS
jgi:hypothetical protein